MSPEEIRLECLKVAIGQNIAPSAVVAKAIELEHYINTGQAGGPPAPEDSPERRAAKPAKKASTAPARAGEASGQSAKGKKPGPKPPASEN